MLPSFILPVFGLSGVGKTHLIERAVEDFPVCIRVSASNVITDALPDAVEPDELRSLPREAIQSNQQLVVNRISAIARSHPDRLMLVDAHSVIDNGHSLVKVPVNVVRTLRPAGMVFVFDTPSAIASRRKGDSTRKRPLRSAEELSFQQDVALTTCRGYESALGADLAIVQADDYQTFSSVIESVIRAAKR